MLTAPSAQLELVESSKVLGIVTMVPVTVNQYFTIQALFFLLLWARVVLFFVVCEHDLTMDALLENSLSDIGCCYHSNIYQWRMVLVLLPQ